MIKIPHNVVAMTVVAATFLQSSAFASRSSIPEMTFSKMELSRYPLTASGSIRASDFDSKRSRFTANPARMREEKP